MAKMRTYVLLPKDSRKDVTIGYDMKEIVRCCECRYKKTCIHCTNGVDEDGFCAWGDKEDGEKDINVPGKKGHWVDDGDPSEWVCSECGYRVERHNNTPFCHHCGADMRDGGEQE